MNADMRTMKPINPWVGMLAQPRETMRFILDTDPRHLTHSLAFVGGAVAQVLVSAISYGGGSIVGAALLGGVSGLITLYTSGFLLTQVGRLLGGRGSGADVRAALAWSKVPTLWGLVLVAALVIGLGVTGIDLGIFDGSSTILMVAVAVVMLWSTVTQYKAVGEAHDFSTWRSLLAHVIVSLVFVVVLVVLATMMLNQIDPNSTPDTYWMSV